LCERESLLKVLYEKAPLGYQSLDENGHFIVVNQTWLDTLGYSREEVLEG
jgi:two-component system, cell cycle sensor histidine kinase and response regulator CckA